MRLSEIVEKLRADFDELLAALEKNATAEQDVENLTGQLLAARKEAHLNYEQAIVADEKHAAAQRALQEASAADEQCVLAWLMELEPIVGDADAFAPKAPLRSRVLYAVRKAVYDYRLIFHAINLLAWGQLDAPSMRQIARRAVTATLAWRKNTRILWTENEPTP